jgi:hypothetical protein
MVTIVTVVLFFVLDMQLIPLKAEAQACVDLKLSYCLELFPIIEDLKCWLRGDCSERHCRCPNGYVAVTTAFSSGCVFTATPGDYWWLVLGSCPIAGYTTLCIGGPS